MSVFGSRVRRIEGRPLLTGQARFVADIAFPDQLHMRIARSPIAFGRLLGVDTLAAAVDAVIGRPGAIDRLPITPRRLHAVISRL